MLLPRRAQASVAAGVSVALLAGGCGSSGKTGGSGNAGTKANNAQNGSSGGGGRVASASQSGGSETAQTAAAVAAARASKHNVIATPTKPAKGKNPPGMPDDEVNPSGAKPVDPCSLVSRSEAQSLDRQPIVSAIDAPQGPTCVYTPHQGSLITLALVGRQFSTVRRSSQLHHRFDVHVGAHAAYCGEAGATGTPTMVVPLSQGRLLVITAPCPIAASFAATALPRIPPSAT